MSRIDRLLHSSWDGIGKGKKNGLIKRWRSSAAEICNNIVLTDKIPTKIVNERNFIVHEPNDGRVEDIEAHGVISYTDGSVLDNKTGCGVPTVKGNRVIYSA